MEEGFTLEDNLERRVVSAWYRGKPVKGFFQGVKIAKLPRIPIQTWRCTACGRLESYAAG